MGAAELFRENLSIFSPKKESCLTRDSRRSSDELTGQPFSSEARSEKAKHRESLKLRDKALPDRLVIASLLCDAIVIVYALIFSFWLRFQTPIVEIGIPAHVFLAEYAACIAFGTLVLLSILTLLGVYDRHALLRYQFVALRVLKASAFWMIGFLGAALAFKFQPPISRIFVMISAVLVPSALLGWRAIFHGYLRRSVIVVNLRQRVLFVGWNDEADSLLRTFSSDPGSAYEVVGCVSSKRERYHRNPQTRMLGTFKDITEIIHHESIDMVVLTDINGLRGDIVGLANTCEREMVQFKVIPSFFQILVSGLHLETVSGVPILGVSRLPLDRFVNFLIKRTVDVVGSIVGLIIAAPLVAVFGAILYRESPGPIFYRQRRLGRHGIEFYIYKIRSMRLDAEVNGKPGWTTKDDPRRLKIGTFMRKWNIDEIPQFWNVLKGEMSLVGPRPERPELISGFKHEIPHYNARHNAKPGITGWAQVKGLRGDTDLTDRINSDLWYLENWSPLLDVQIMFLTFVKHGKAH